MKQYALPFAALLVALHVSTQAQAGTICVSGYVCDDRPPPPEYIQPPTVPAVSFEFPPIVFLPYQDSSEWNYGFAVPANAQSASMPYFVDSGVFSENVPDGWSYAVGAPNTQGMTTATWQRLPASASDFGLFSFKSIYSPSEATYQVTFDDSATRSYPFFIPYSPMAQAAGYTSFSATVPEPGALNMAALGLVACVVAKMNRKKAN